MFPFRKSSQPRVISVHSYYLTSSLDLAFCKLNEPHSTYSFLDFMYFTHHLPQIFFCIFRFGGSSCEIPFENCSFVLFSHHGLPSFSVFFSCFGFLRWNCRFPKFFPAASLRFFGSFWEISHGWLLFLLWIPWNENFSVCALFYDDAQVLFSEDLWNCLLYRLLPCDYMLSQIICHFKPQYCIK